MRIFNYTLSRWLAICTIGVLATIPLVELSAHGAGGGGAGAKPPTWAEPSKRDSDIGNTSDEDEPLPGLENAEPEKDTPAAKSDDKDIWKDEDAVYVPSSDPDAAADSDGIAPVEPGDQDADIVVVVHKWRLTKFLHAVQIDPPGEGFGGLAPLKWPFRYSPTSLAPHLLIDADEGMIQDWWNGLYRDHVKATKDALSQSSGPSKSVNADDGDKDATTAHQADPAISGGSEAGRSDDADEPLPGLEDTVGGDDPDEPLPRLEDAAANDDPDEPLPGLDGSVLDDDPDEPLPGLEDTLESETPGVGTVAEEKPDGFVSLRSNDQPGKYPNVTEAQWGEYQGFFTAQAFFAGWLQRGLFHAAVYSTEDQEESIERRLDTRRSASRSTPPPDADSGIGEASEDAEDPALYD